MARSRPAECEVIMTVTFAPPRREGNDNRLSCDPGKQPGPWTSPRALPKFRRAGGLVLLAGFAEIARIHAPIRLFSAAAQGESERGADRLASPDAARRHDPPVERRDLFLAAARLPRPQEGRADRPRGAGPRRRPRGADADYPARRSLAGERSLRR